MSFERKVIHRTHDFNPSGPAIASGASSFSRPTRLDRFEPSSSRRPSLPPVAAAASTPIVHTRESDRLNAMLRQTLGRGGGRSTSPLRPPIAVPPTMIPSLDGTDDNGDEYTDDELVPLSDDGGSSSLGSEDALVFATDDDDDDNDDDDDDDTTPTTILRPPVQPRRPLQQPQLQQRRISVVRTVENGEEADCDEDVSIQAIDSRGNVHEERKQVSVKQVKPAGQSSFASSTSIPTTPTVSSLPRRGSIGSLSSSSSSSTPARVIHNNLSSRRQYVPASRVIQSIGATECDPLTGECVSDVKYADGHRSLIIQQSIAPSEVGAAAVLPQNEWMPRIIFPNAKQSTLLRQAHVEDFKSQRDLNVRTLPMRSDKCIQPEENHQGPPDASVDEYIRLQAKRDRDSSKHTTIQWMEDEIVMVVKAIGIVRESLKIRNITLKLPTTVTLIKSDHLSGEFAGWDRTAEPNDVHWMYHYQTLQLNSRGTHGVIAIALAKLREVHATDDEAFVNGLARAFEREWIMMTFIENPPLLPRLLQMIWPTIWKMLPSQTLASRELMEKVTTAASKRSGGGAGTSGGMSTATTGAGDRFEDHHFPPVPIQILDNGILIRRAYHPMKLPMDIITRLMSPSITPPSTSSAPMVVTVTDAADYIVMYLQTQPDMSSVDETTLSTKAKSKCLDDGKLPSKKFYNILQVNEEYRHSTGSGTTPLPYKRVPIELKLTTRLRRTNPRDPGGSNGTVERIEFVEPADPYVDFYSTPEPYLVKGELGYNQATGQIEFVINDGADVLSLNHAKDDPRTLPLQMDPTRLIVHTFNKMMTEMDPFKPDDSATPGDWLDFARQMYKILQDDTALRRT